MHSFYEATTHSEVSTDGSSHPPPVLPIGGWKPFPTATLPQLFSYGHIYHHLIESAIFVKPTATPGDGSEDSDGDMTLDVGTEKPMRKGRVYFLSGHVQKMFDFETDKFYFVKCRCMASYDVTKLYHVTVTLSKDSGYVKDTSCDCKASALGRCNHVAGLLFALLDWLDKGQKSCTSKLCEWNVGRKAKRPKVLHESEYSSVTGKPVERAKKKPAETMNFDPRPPSLRVAADTPRVNRFISNLQLALNGEASMWERIVPIVYDDFTLTAEEERTIKVNVEQFIASLEIDDTETGPSEVVQEQGSDAWIRARACRITASIVKSVSGYVDKSSTTVTNLLRRLMWETHKKLTTAAVKYGNDNEETARQAYRDAMQNVSPGLQVVESGKYSIINKYSCRRATSTGNQILQFFLPISGASGKQLTIHYTFK